MTNSDLHKTLKGNKNMNINDKEQSNETKLFKIDLPLALGDKLYKYDTSSGLVVDYTVSSFVMNESGLTIGTKKIIDNRTVYNTFPGNDIGKSIFLSENEVIENILSEKHTKLKQTLDIFMDFCDKNNIFCSVSETENDITVFCDKMVSSCSRTDVQSINKLENDLKYYMANRKTRTEYIMFKDTPVIKLYYGENTTKIDILNKEYAPVQFLVDSSDKEKVCLNFKQKRNPVLTNENSELINQYIEAQNIKDENRQERIADLFYCTSVTDSYWIKNENDQVSWKDINPRVNELKDICKDENLSYKMEYQNKVNVMKDNTVETLWGHDTSDNVSMYIHGTPLETKTNVMTSELLDYTNIPHVKYEQVSECCCKCENIANEKYSIVSREDMNAYCESKGIDINAFMKKIDPQLYYQLQIGDFLLKSINDTLYTQEFLRDNDTGNIVGLLPIYNNKGSFLAEETFKKRYPGKEKYEDEDRWYGKWLPYYKEWTDKIESLLKSMAEDKNEILSLTGVELNEELVKLYFYPEHYNLFQDKEKRKQFLAFFYAAKEIGFIADKSNPAGEILYVDSGYLKSSSEIEHNIEYEYNFESESFITSNYRRAKLEKQNMFQDSLRLSDNLFYNLPKNGFTVKHSFSGDMVNIEINEKKYSYNPDKFGAIGHMNSIIEHILNGEEVEEQTMDDTEEEEER